jgi:hypothetical protein
MVSKGTIVESENLALRDLYFRANTRKFVDEALRNVSKVRTRGISLGGVALTVGEKIKLDGFAGSLCKVDSLFLRTKCALFCNPPFLVSLSGRPITWLPQNVKWNMTSNHTSEDKAKGGRPCINSGSRSAFSSVSASSASNETVPSPKAAVHTVRGTQSLDRWVAVNASSHSTEIYRVECNSQRDSVTS